MSCCSFQVLGNAKGAVAVVISILIFRNPVSVTGMLGYLLTVIGVILYSESKNLKRTTAHELYDRVWVLREETTLIFRSTATKKISVLQSPNTLNC